MARIDNRKVYKENSTYTNDILFTLDGSVTIEEFMAIWHSVKYLY